MEITAPNLNPTSPDWHRADIKAALEKAGWSLRRLSMAHGLDAHTISQALWRPYPHMERLIAHAIGVKPSDIWPSRYAKRPLRRRAVATKDSESRAKRKQKNAKEAS